MSREVAIGIVKLVGSKISRRPRTELLPQFNARKFGIHICACLVRGRNSDMGDYGATGAEAYLCFL